MRRPATTLRSKSPPLDRRYGAGVFYLFLRLVEDTFLSPSDNRDLYRGNLHTNPKEMKTMSCPLLKRVCLAVPVALCFAFNSFAQSNAQRPANPCEAKPEHRQFDFWIGEWDVTANGNRAGENSVQLILGKCVIFENWTGARGMNGKSFNIYNAAKGKWQQTWVDSQGNVLELHGEFKDGAMRFSGETPNRSDGVRRPLRQEKNGGGEIACWDDGARRGWYRLPGSDQINLTTWRTECSNEF
jgi:hypothetical protein